MGEPDRGLGGERRLPTTVIYLFSALVIAAAVVLTSALGLGTRTSYGSGINVAIGSQVQRDFLADQLAEASALSKADPALIGGFLTENALVDVSQQISDETSAGTAVATVSFQPSSITILQANDPADPALTIEVQEDGTKNVTTQADQNSAPVTQNLSFRGDFWLRKESSGRYAIADQKITIQPASPLPAIALVFTAIVAVAILLILRWRQRYRLVASPTLPSGTAATVMAVTAAAPIAPAPAPIAATSATLIRTFGGLQVHRDGQDWAAAFNPRPLTAFIWLRLLVDAIRFPGRGVVRDQLGREARPGLDRETQLKQIRNAIHRLRELPPALAECIRVTPQILMFDLTGREVDAVNLLAVAKQSASHTSLTGMQLARAQAVIDSSSGVFLPEFESIEDVATDHHPTCTELIRELREELTSRRLSLMALVADSYLDSGRAAEAVDLLEPVFQSHPDQTALRARLINAYEKAGRPEAAAGLQMTKS